MLKRLIYYIRSFFNFSHAESEGFLLMSLLVGALAVFFLVYDAIPSEGYTSFLQDKALLDSLADQIESGMNVQAGSSGTEISYGTGAEMEVQVQVFFFNPNLLTVDSLMMLGIPAGLARRIDNYRQKGGEFRKQEDLLKIYGFPDSLYHSLKPYIQIVPPSHERDFPPPGSSAEKGKGREQEKAESPFDINKADSLKLLQIKGIGPVLSSRIIRFRNKLGGFAQMEQLYEVYGLDSLVVQNLLNRAYVEKNFVPEQIFINSASQEQLAEHPYINPFQARLIFSYRTEHGPFQSINDLLKIHTFDQIFVRKIAPYIRLE